jgi:hypothetical protein
VWSLLQLSAETFLARTQRQCVPQMRIPPVSGDGVSQQEAHHQSYDGRLLLPQDHPLTCQSTCQYMLNMMCKQFSTAGLLKVKSFLQPFWYFPIKEIIQKWLDNPRFESLRKEAISERRGGYMDATEFTRLNNLTNGILLEHSTLLVEVGLDWGSMFKSSQHSVGIVVIKCAFPLTVCRVLHNAHTHHHQLSPATSLLWCTHCASVTNWCLQAI